MSSADRHPPYPAFLQIAGWKVLVVGGGPVAERKAAVLADCGASVRVVAPDASSRLRRMGCAVARRRFRDSDLRGVRLVVAATDDEALNRRIARLSARRGALCNAADSPGDSHFLVPASVRRGAFCVAVSTGGAGPAFARSVRRRLERTFGPEYGEFAGLLASFRPRVLASGLPAETREALFRRMAGAFGCFRREGPGAARRKLAAILRRCKR